MNVFDLVQKHPGVGKHVSANLTVSPPVFKQIVVNMWRNNQKLMKNIRFAEGRHGIVAHAFVCKCLRRFAMCLSAVKTFAI